MTHSGCNSSSRESDAGLLASEGTRTHVQHTPSLHSHKKKPIETKLKSKELNKNSYTATCCQEGRERNKLPASSIWVSTDSTLCAPGQESGLCRDWPAGHKEGQGVGSPSLPGCRPVPFICSPDINRRAVKSRILPDSVFVSSPLTRMSWEGSILCVPF